MGQRLDLALSYQGMRVDGRCVVWACIGSGRIRDLDPRYDIRNHSPDGFNWGYGGSGPAQLALALLCDALRDDRLAERFYQAFKFEVVASMTQDGFTLSWKTISDWVRAKLASFGESLPIAN